ncbi:hypothetical protein J3U99_20085 [Brucella pituitosa]|uniref:hypothetical protein n=1 Tax=Brucella pituitosa TaxID=571256 RepID=UPI0020044A4D|nr:hypothetical protein [Brucella pituitosa]MCK4207076.1 hypothetical protein [Brucella pituitosa]
MPELRTDNFKLELCIIEHEMERFPSFKTRVNVEFYYPLGFLEYDSAKVWFSMDDWNDFFAAIQSEESICEVSDLSSDVKIQFSRDDLKNRVQISLRRSVVGIGEGELNLDLVEGGDFQENLLKFAGGGRTPTISESTVSL